MSAIRTIILGILIVMLIGWNLHVDLNHRTEIARLKNHIPNVCEIQEKLQDTGYYSGEIDGIWGEETARAYANWCAVREIEDGSENRAQH